MGKKIINLFAIILKKIKNSSPSMTELEMAMTDWLGRAAGLPESFMNSDSGLGAGIIQNTASEATFIAIISARGRAINVLKNY